MAPGPQALRALTRSCRQPLPFWCIRPTAATIQRPLSTTPFRRKDAGDDEDNIRRYDNPGDVVNDLLQGATLSEAEQEEARKAQKAWEELPYEQKMKVKNTLQTARSQLGRAGMVAPKNAFWNEEEKDPEMITSEFGEDDFEEDDITSMAHGKLEEHREFREYARITVWEMPLLASEF
jgi:small subunit ribosomal protein S35